jgi:hypothetical protein
MTDGEFKAFVLQNREFGYGRMMQVISGIWQKADPIGALTVGEAYGSEELKRERCQKEGHDRSRSGWCDRCGASPPSGCSNRG